VKNEKYEFIYEYGRAALEEELQRFQNIENKSARYLGLLSVGVVAYTVLLRSFSSSIFPPNGFLDYAACVVVGGTYLAMASSWSFLYRSITFSGMPRLQFDKNFIERCESMDLPTIHLALTRSCAEAIEVAREQNSEKVHLLVMAYKEIALSMWGLTGSVILILANNL